MTTIPLTSVHNVGMFCNTTASRYDLGSVQYDAAHRCLVATDGAILVLTPLEAGEKDFRIEGRALTGAFAFQDGAMPPDVMLDLGDDGRCSSVQAIGKRTREVWNSQTDDTTRFPSVWKLDAFNPDWQPPVAFCLATDVLQRLCQYAAQIKATNRITFRYSPAEEQRGMQVFIHASGQSPLAIAVVMPCQCDTLEESRKYHEEKCSAWKAIISDKSQVVAVPPEPAAIEAATIEPIAVPKKKRKKENL